MVKEKLRKGLQMIRYMESIPGPNVEEATQYFSLQNPEERLHFHLEKFVKLGFMDRDESRKEPRYRMGDELFCALTILDALNEIKKRRDNKPYFENRRELIHFFFELIKGKYELDEEKLLSDEEFLHEYERLLKRMKRT